MDNFLLNQDKKLKKAEEDAAKKILKLLNSTRLEVIDSLTNSEYGYNQTYLLTILRNTDFLLEELKAQLGQEFFAILTEATDFGIQHQSEFIEKYIKDKNSNIDYLFAPVELIVLTNLEMNINEYLGKFTLGLREKIKNTIQQGFINGRTESETIALIKENFHTEIGTTARAVHHIYQTSYNLANFEVIKDLALDDDQIQKQWYSMLDQKTTPVCKHLHLQIQPVEKPFVDETNGAKFMYPPAVYAGAIPTFHFCRSRVIPFIKGVSNG